MEGREKSRGLSLGKRRKREKERRHGWGGMKGNGENVGEDKRKEERNDGRKGTVNRGGSCCTYGRGLLYLRKSTGKNKSVRKRKLPNFIFKCLRKHFFNDQNMVHPEYGVIGYLNEH